MTVGGSAVPVGVPGDWVVSLSLVGGDLVLGFGISGRELKVGSVTGLLNSLSTISELNGINPVCRGIQIC